MCRIPRLNSKILHGEQRQIAEQVKFRSEAELDAAVEQEYEK